ncbi:MAG: alpha-N-arabinofuranosidase [Lachnospiraceae bacterium]|nr:alpha-N-arabinofuranosidase [Lachnospiraceae bacterium]
MFHLYLNPNDKKGRINPEIYGHFSEHLGRCIYDGIYVGEDSDIPNVRGIRSDVVEAFRKIKMPVLRWPGGCFADEYHWKDGIGEKSLRKKMVNTNWGGVTEDNSFGTHEFMDLCEQVGCEPYIAGNLGSGSVEELAQWVEYMTFDGVSPMADLRRKNGREKPWKLKYLGVGNENWGCGGNMCPQFYANQYKRYQSFCHDFGDNKLYKVACGPGSDDYEWTETLMKSLRPNHVQAISLHYYTFMDGWDKKGSALEFSDRDYYKTLKESIRIDEVITRHIEIMNRYDPEKKIDLLVDEWGNWFDVEEGTNPGFLYQQNTMRDAVTAALYLNIFNRHCDRVKMANIAQVVNVLQAVILTKDEKMILTPTYHVFDLFSDHQSGELVYSHLEEKKISEFELPMLSYSASEKDDVITVTIANLSLEEDAQIELAAAGISFNAADGQVIAGDAHAHNDFDAPDQVMIKELGTKLEDGKVMLTLPRCSVAKLTLKK